MPLNHLGYLGGIQHSNDHCFWWCLVIQITGANDQQAQLLLWLLLAWKAVFLQLNFQVYEMSLRPSAVLILYSTIAAIQLSYLRKKLTPLRQAVRVSCAQVFQSQHLEFTERVLLAHMYRPCCHVSPELLVEDRCGQTLPLSLFIHALAECLKFYFFFSWNKFSFKDFIVPILGDLDWALLAYQTCQFF